MVRLYLTNQSTHMIDNFLLCTEINKTVYISDLINKRNAVSEH